MAITYTFRGTNLDVQIAIESFTIEWFAKFVGKFGQLKTLMVLNIMVVKN